MAKHPLDLIDENEFGGALYIQRSGEDYITVVFKCGDEASANAFYRDLKDKLATDGAATIELTVPEPPNRERLQ